MMWGLKHMDHMDISGNCMLVGSLWTCPASKYLWWWALVATATLTCMHVHSSLIISPWWILPSQFEYTWNVLKLILNRLFWPGYVVLCPLRLLSGRSPWSGKLWRAQVLSLRFSHGNRERFASIAEQAPWRLYKYSIVFCCDPGFWDAQKNLTGKGSGRRNTSRKD